MSDNNFDYLLRDCTIVMAWDKTVALSICSKLLRYCLTKFGCLIMRPQENKMLLECCEINNQICYEKTLKHLSDIIENLRLYQQTSVEQLITALDSLINCHRADISNSKTLFVYNLNCFLHNLLSYCQIYTWIDKYPNYYAQWQSQTFEEDYVSFLDCAESLRISNDFSAELKKQVNHIINMDKIFELLEENEYVPKIKI